jgi:tight adherence protein B
VRPELIAAALVVAALAVPPARPAAPAVLRRRLSAVADRRLARRVDDQLPLVAAELAAQVRAGRSLAQAIEGCAADLPEPVAGRMAAAAAATSLGEPPSEAIVVLGDGDEVRLIAAAVGLQTRVGGDLAEVLDRMSTTLLERRAQRRAAAVATAQARATARMVGWLPVVGLGALYLVDRPAVSGLIRSPFGWAALAASAGLTALAHVVIRRIARVAG